jgi:hypothetical protein
MTAIYGPLFVSKHGMSDNGIWLETLQDLTPKAMESGMLRLKQLKGAKAFIDFPPNCLQFRALCLAFYEELHLPTASEAYREIKGKYYSTGPYWSHKIVKYIAYHLPQDFLLIEQEQKAYALFETLYREIGDLVRQGHEIPEVSEPKLLKHQTNYDVGRHHMTIIKESLRGQYERGCHDAVQC